MLDAELEYLYDGKATTVVAGHGMEYCGGCGWDVWATRVLTVHENTIHNGFLCPDCEKIYVLFEVALVH